LKSDVLRVWIHNR